MFHTIICDLLGIRYPILQGAMQGGGGCAGCGRQRGGRALVCSTLAALTRNWSDIVAVALTTKPFGVNIMPLGCGITERCKYCVGGAPT